MLPIPHSASPVSRPPRSCRSRWNSQSHQGGPWGRKGARKYGYDCNTVTFSVINTYSITISYNIDVYDIYIYIHMYDYECNYVMECNRIESIANNDVYQSDETTVLTRDIGVSWRFSLQANLRLYGICMNMYCNVMWSNNVQHLLDIQGLFCLFHNNLHVYNDNHKEAVL